MKQFIVLAAVLPILMIFVTQTVYDQRSNLSVGIVNDMVYAAKEEAKAEGSFTWEIKERLRQDLARALSVRPEEIKITCREEGGLLYYRVEAPIKNVMAGGRLLGIKDKDNQYMYVIDSYTRGIAVQENSDDDDDGDDSDYEEPL